MSVGVLSRRPRALTPRTVIKVPFTPRFGLVLAGVCALQLVLASLIAGGSRLPLVLAALLVFGLATVIDRRVAFIAPLCYLLLSYTEEGSVTLADLILFLGPAVVVCSALTGGEIAQRAGRLMKAHGYKFLVFAFAVLVLVATIKAVTTDAGEGSLKPLRLALFPMVLFGLAVFRDRTEILRALRLCFYLFTVYTFGLAMYYLATGGTATESTVSTGGDRVVANSSAMYAVMAFVLLALHLGQEDRLRVRIGLSALMAMSVATVVLSLARTSWAAGVAVVVILVIFVPTARRGVARFAVTVAPLVVLLGLLLPIVAEDRLQNIRDRVSRPEGPVAQDQSAATREKEWSLMLDLWRETPVFGQGFGQTVRFVGNDERVKVVVNDPHNGFIFILTSMGVVGLTVFLLVHAGFVVSAANAIRGSPVGREVGIWALCAWFVFMANAFFGVLFTITTFGVFLWTVVSIPIALAALPERAGEPEPEEPPEAPARELVPALGSAP